MHYSRTLVAGLGSSLQGYLNNTGIIIIRC